MLTRIGSRHSFQRQLQQPATRSLSRRAIPMCLSPSCNSPVVGAIDTNAIANAISPMTASACTLFSPYRYSRSFSTSSLKRRWYSSSTPAAAASSLFSASAAHSAASPSVSSSSFSSAAVSSSPHTSSSLPPFTYTASSLRVYRPAFALSEAIKLMKCVNPGDTRRDHSVQLAIRLSRDAIKGQQHLRGVVALPNGTGSKVTVAVFAKGEKANEARAAGADFVGELDLVEKIQKGLISFDRCLATPDMMGVVSRVARILGPKGLMPNPKLGTITLDLKSAIKTAKAGQVQYKTDKFGNVHAVIGKLSFSVEALGENIHAFVTHLNKSRPAGVKGAFIQNAVITTTYSRAVPIDLHEPPFLADDGKKGQKKSGSTTADTTSTDRGSAAASPTQSAAVAI